MVGSVSSKTVKMFVLAIIAIGIFLIIVRTITNQPIDSGSTSTVAARTNVAPPQPPVTASEMVAAQNPNGFQLLVSYENTGFEPADTKIKVGETIRFTNDSTADIWVASTGNSSGQLYPGTSNCGGSAFDSCGPLIPGAYWEFTFTEKGTWEFMNNLDKTEIGTITVQ